MNETVNKLLLADDKFMPEIHLKLRRFTYSACGPFTKNKERTQIFKETGDLRHIYRNKLDKTSFQHNMAHEDFKNLARRTASDKVLRDTSSNIAKNPRYNGYPWITFMVYELLGKKSSKGSALKLNEMNN